jgi:hypothetical protein
MKILRERRRANEVWSHEEVSPDSSAPRVAVSPYLIFQITACIIMTSWNTFQATIIQLWGTGHSEWSYYHLFLTLIQLLEQRQPVIWKGDRPRSGGSGMTNTLVGNKSELDGKRVILLVKPPFTKWKRIRLSEMPVNYRYFK